MAPQSRSSPAQRAEDAQFRAMRRFPEPRGKYKELEKIVQEENQENRYSMKINVSLIHANINATQERRTTCGSALSDQSHV